MEKVNILGVQVNMSGIAESADIIFDFLSEDRFHRVYTPNSEIIMVGYKDPEFLEVLNRADLLTADGIGVVYASKILGKPIKERAAGFDIAKELLGKISKSGHKLYLFGGKPGVAEEAKANIERDYPGISIVGTRNGYFKPDEVPEIIEEINNSGADVLFVCLGAPAQEKWIYANRASLPNVKLFLALGGSLDGYAGNVKRAPKIFIKLGLEWFYRLLCEPWRFKRMLKLPKFYFGTWKYKFTSK